jgi:signal peptidase II
MAAFALVVLADQAVKLVLVSVLPGGRAVNLGALVRIRPVRGNSTIANALGMPRWVLPILWAGSLAALVVLAPATGLFGGSVARAGLGTALGGAASNLLDQSLRGGVVDYLGVGFWPSFNLADGAIVVGVIVALAAA